MNTYGIILTEDISTTCIWKEYKVEAENETEAIVKFLGAVPPKIKIVNRSGYSVVLIEELHFRIGIWDDCEEDRPKEVIEIK